MSSVLPAPCFNCDCPWNSCLIHNEFCCDACAHFNFDPPHAHDCEHTSLQHGADGCNVPGCLCAFMSWDES